MALDPSIARSLLPGTVGEAEITVEEADLADAPGVFGTPEMVRLMERAAIAAVAPFLPDGWTSVGTEISVRHLAPTLPGSRVWARAVLAQIDGRRLKFTVDAFNPTRKIGEGTQERVLVQLATLMKRARRA
jgi:predicted thioesterase